jgi:hypothetical protein
MCEIFNAGDKPFGEIMADRAVWLAILNGERPARPPTCPLVSHYLLALSLFLHL